MIHPCFRTCLLCLLFVLSLVSVSISAQSKRVDSLQAVVNRTDIDDTTRINTLCYLALAIYTTDPDKTEHYAREAITLARKIDFKIGIAAGYHRIAIAMLARSRFQESLRFNDTALVLSESLNDKKGIASIFNSIAVSYTMQGNDARALEYYTKALVLDNETNDGLGMGLRLSNIGDIYQRRQQFDKALEHYLKSVPLLARHRPERLGLPLLGIGIVYRQQGVIDKAITYLEQSVGIFQREADNEDFAIALRELASVKREQGRHDEAIKLLSRALDAAVASKNKQVEASVWTERSATLRLGGNSTEAIASARQALETATAFHVKLEIRNAAEALALAYHSAGQYQKVLAAYQLFVRYKDSVEIEETAKKIVAYEYETKLRQQQIETEILRTEQVAQRQVMYTVGGGLTVTVVLLLLVMRSNAQRKRAYIKLTKQKVFLETQSAEIERVNLRLQQQNIDLAALSAEKTELMSIVAHDLKNPLGAIRGFAELTEGARPEEVPNTVREIISISDRMIDLVTNLLDLNRLEQGGMRFTIVSFDIAPMVKNTVRQYQTTAEAKNIRLHCSNEAEESFVLADEQAIAQVLDNIISNAVKYSPHGKNIYVRVKSEGGNMKQKYTITSSLNPQISSFLRVEIQDEGPGISSEDMKKLFGKFARLSARPTGGEHSTGLGLSIVKKMVEAMDGRVWCESELGKGATFIVELPAAKAE